MHRNKLGCSAKWVKFTLIAIKPNKNVLPFLYMPRVSVLKLPAPDI